MELIRVNIKMKKPCFLLLLFTISSINAQEIGYIKFEFNIDSAVVVLDSDLLGRQTIGSGDSLRLITGTHLIQVYPPLDEKQESFKFVYPDSTVVMKFNFSNTNISTNAVDGNFASQDYFDSNFMLVTDRDSEIYLRGELIGTGFVKLNSLFRAIELTVKNPDFGSKSIDFSIGDGVAVYEYYRRPSESLAKSLSVLPGISQFYKKQVLKGLGLSAATISLVALGISKTTEYSAEEKNFISLRNRYNDATDEQEAFLLGNLTEEQHDIITKLDTQRKLLFGSALLMYAFNIYDGYTSTPKGGYKNAKPLNFYLSIEDGTFGSVNTATLRVNFSRK
tara:strand:+ start:13985 stop:14989 length:1005 start_codon:yes stop_codon:yes gene_type:complete